MIDSMQENPQKGPCGCFIGLWVDDVRPLPHDLRDAGYCWARSFHEAIIKLELMNFAEVSLDHDLASFYGNKEMTGQDILWWLVARKMEGEYTPRMIRVHSANPVGRKAMLSIINDHFPWE